MQRFEGTSSYVATEDLKVAVNAAVTLRRPLLVKGEPGTGKTVLAQEVASAMGAPLIEWGGVLRWLAFDGEASVARAAVAAAGGHATLFRGEDKVKSAAGVFQPLPDAVMQLQRKLKRAFDPQGLFNPGRMYADL